MLTVLDGSVEMRNRVIVGATNYIDRIDKALLRPGRFDLVIKFEKFNNEETIELLEKIFQKSEHVNCIKDKKYKSYAPAEIINMCHELRDVRKVVDVLKE